MLLPRDGSAASTALGFTVSKMCLFSDSIDNPLTGFSKPLFLKSLTALGTAALSVKTQI